MLLEVGRVCIKKFGHEAEQKCIVVDAEKPGFVVIAGPRVKKRRCNIKHLEILPQTISIKKGAGEAEAADALLKAGIISNIDLKGKPVDYKPRERGGERTPVAPKKIGKKEEKPKPAKKAAPKKMEEGKKPEKK